MLSSVLNAVVTDLTALNLTLNSVSLGVFKRKGVKKESTVDGSQRLVVAESEKGEIAEYVAFQQVTKRHRVDIAVLTPNADDWLSNLDTYCGWRESIANLYLPPLVLATTLMTLSGVWDVRVRPNRFLDRDAMHHMYDLQLITLEVGVTS